MSDRIIYPELQTFFDDVFKDYRARPANLHCFIGHGDDPVAAVHNLVRVLEHEIQRLYDVEVPDDTARELATAGDLEKVVESYPVPSIPQEEIFDEPPVATPETIAENDEFIAAQERERRDAENAAENAAENEALVK